MNMMMTTVVAVLLLMVHVFVGSGQHGVRGMTVSCSKDIERFVQLDLTTNLQEYILHEEFRLRIIMNDSKYADEVPLVRQRIKDFKSVHAGLVKNQTSNRALLDSASQNHPTSVFVVIRNYFHALGDKLKNATLYGPRLEEFLKRKVKIVLPTHEDLFRASAVITYLQRIHNISREDIVRGQMKGHQGAPLNAADCYHIGKVSSQAKLVDESIEWTRMALNFVDLTSPDVQKTSTFNVTDAMVILAKALLTKEMKEEAVALLEKATEIDPEDMVLHRLYLTNRFGRKVSTLKNIKMDPTVLKFFELCANLSAGHGAGPRAKPPRNPRCRYKAHASTPYWRYREEILSNSPYITLIHDFLGEDAVNRVLNVSQDKPYREEKNVPGDSITQLWQSKMRTIPDFYNPVIGDLSRRVGYVTGLGIRQGPGRISLGEPIHVIDFGPGGTHTPHRDAHKVYHKQYMGLHSSTRLSAFTVFLSDTIEGGHMVFPELNITIAPKKRMAVHVYNDKPSGVKEPNLLVAMCPVVMGRNTVLQKGIFSSGFDDNVLCGQTPKSTHFSVEKARGCIAGPCGAPNVYTNQLY